MSDTQTLDLGYFNSKYFTDYKDSRMEVLDRASNMWKERELHPREMRLTWARYLNDSGLFSLAQIAAIVGLSHGAISRRLKKNGVGGRFNPGHLRRLAIFRKQVLNGSKPDIRAVVSMAQEGTSIKVIARLVGVSHAALYERAKNVFAGEEL